MTSNKHSVYATVRQGLPLAMWHVATLSHKSLGRSTKCKNFLLQRSMLSYPQRDLGGGEKRWYKRQCFTIGLSVRLRHAQPTKMGYEPTRSCLRMHAWNYNAKPALINPYAVNWGGQWSSSLYQPGLLGWHLIHCNLSVLFQTLFSDLLSTNWPNCSQRRLSVYHIVVICCGETCDNRSRGMLGIEI
jgi:hypothetical protein